MHMDKTSLNLFIPNKNPEHSSTPPTNLIRKRSSVCCIKQPEKCNHTQNSIRSNKVHKRLIRMKVGRLKKYLLLYKKQQVFGRRNRCGRWGIYTHIYLHIHTVIFRDYFSSFDKILVHLKLQTCFVLPGLFSAIRSLKKMLLVSGKQHSFSRIL